MTWNSRRTGGCNTLGGTIQTAEKHYTLFVPELRFTETDFKYSADGNNPARRIRLTGSAAIILGTTDQELIHVRTQPSA
jgi:hypothetical protein